MLQSPKQRRNSLRLNGYDYSSIGGYFVTICTNLKVHILSNIVDNEIMLSMYGEIARHCWLAIPEHFEQVSLDMYVIMPNHIHGIIFIKDKLDNINEPVEAKHVSPLQPLNKMGSPPKSISAIISSFKASVTREIRKQQTDTEKEKIWQRGFYDHIIRNEDDLRRIQQYIHDNPLKWESDDYYS